MTRRVCTLSGFQTVTCSCVSYIYSFVVCVCARAEKGFLYAALDVLECTQ